MDSEMKDTALDKGDGQWNERYSNQGWKWPEGHLDFVNRPTFVM